MRNQRIPAYRRQRGRSSDRAYVCLNGRRYYLGKYGSPESEEEYRRLIAEWASDSGQARTCSSDLTVIELIARFWQHAQSYYRRLDGTPTSEIDNYRQALRPLKSLYGRTAADAFGPKALKVLRQHMVELGWARTNINKMVSRIKHVFRWATENELVSPEVYHGLRAVSGLKWGRTKAKETEPVRPVPEAHIEAIQPNMAGRIWTYEPVHHKNAHHGHKRTIYIGPKAQEVIKPFLADRPVDTCLFSAAEAQAERRARAHKLRKTPLQSGNSPGTNRKRAPKVTPRNCYTCDTYRRAIQRACDKAGIPPWHPHQLRHNAATRLRAEFGLEGAQLILGHRKADVTQVYAEVNLVKAIEIATKVG